MQDFLTGFFLGIPFSYILNILFDFFFGKNTKFKIGDTVYWRHVEEVGDTNSEWRVVLKSGKVVSIDARVCIEEENKNIVFIEKEKLYTTVIKLKLSIGATLSPKEDFWNEASKVII